MSKTIQEMADKYVGHPKEINEDSCITAKRESFKQGANAVLEKVERLLNSQKFVDNPSKELFELIEQLKK